MSQPQSQRSASLDGLRGLAVLAVIGFHTKISGFEGGLLSMPVFFILSGYLVTLQIQAAPIGSFYWKRTLRIVPAAYAYLIVNLLAALYMGWAFNAYPLHFAFLTNEVIARAMPANYDGYVGQLWTLAIEVQFYLLWPLALLLLKRRAIWALAAAFLLAPLWRALQHNPYAAAITFPAVMDMFAAGAFIALRPDTRCLPWAAALGATILALCLTRISYFDLGSILAWAPVATWLYTGSALLFAALIGGLARHGARPLCWPPLLYLARISYGVYLWHLLLIAGCAYVGYRWAGLPLTIAVAALSWHFFERPIQKLTLHARNPRNCKTSISDAIAARDSASTVAPPVGSAIAAATGPGST